MQIPDEMPPSTSPLPQKAHTYTDKIKQAVGMVLLPRSSYTGGKRTEIGAAYPAARDKAAAVVR